ncbi:MAG: hypothetical protein MPW15_15710 [Candidatus Manganitrophus sp.]|nr:hypothetical protein [Candidatus Manganitrophus sp.]
MDTIFASDYLKVLLSDLSHELFLDGFIPAGESSTFTGSVRLRYADSVVNDFNTIDSDIYDGIQPSLSLSLSTDDILGGRVTLSGALFMPTLIRKKQQMIRIQYGDDYAYVGFSPTLSFDFPLIQGVNLNLSYGYSIQSYLHPDSLLEEIRVSHGHSVNGGITVGLERGIAALSSGDLAVQ